MKKPVLVSSKKHPKPQKSLLNHEFSSNLEDFGVQTGVKKVKFLLNLFSGDVLLVGHDRLVVVMQGDEFLDGGHLKHGLIDVREERLVADVVYPTSPRLEVVPEELGAVVVVLLQKPLRELEQLFLGDVNGVVFVIHDSAAACKVSRTLLFV